MSSSSSSSLVPSGNFPFGRPLGLNNPFAQTAWNAANRIIDRTTSYIGNPLLRTGARALARGVLDRGVRRLNALSMTRRGGNVNRIAVRGLAGRTRRSRRRVARVRRRFRRLVRKARRNHRIRRLNKKRVPQYNVIGKYSKRRVSKRFLTRRRFRRKFGRAGWYSIGKWVLVGNYIDPTSNINLPSTYSYFQLQDRDRTSNWTQPLGWIRQVPTVGTGTKWYILSNLHFNVQNSSNGNFVSNVWVTKPDMTSARSSAFSYTNATNAPVLADTALARMPPVPIDSVTFTSDTSTTLLTSTDDNMYTNQHYIVPYACKWTYVYIQFQYSIKIAWPEAWGALDFPDLEPTTSNNNTVVYPVLPPNPPLYVRFFMVRTIGDGRITSADFIRACFPRNSPINTRFTPEYRKNLWALKSVLVYSKTFVLTGRILPKFEGAENLTDFEEGKFVVRVPYKTVMVPQPYYATGVTNTNYIPNWPTPDSIGYIQWFVFAGLLSDGYQVDHTTFTSVDIVKGTLTPTVTYNFSPLVYCFPRFRKPYPKYPYSSYFGNQSFFKSAQVKVFDDEMELRKAEVESKLDVEEQNHNSQTQTSTNLGNQESSSQHQDSSADLTRTDSSEAQQPEMSVSQAVAELLQ